MHKEEQMKMNLNWIFLGYLSKPRRVWILQSCDGCKLYSQPQYFSIYNLFFSTKDTTESAGSITTATALSTMSEKNILGKSENILFPLWSFQIQVRGLLDPTGSKVRLLLRTEVPRSRRLQRGTSFRIREILTNLLINKKACLILPVGYIIVYCRTAKKKQL